jgi:hypothetical protein
MPRACNAGFGACIAALLPTVEEGRKLHHFDIDESLLDELDVLIEEYGEDVLAIDFDNTGKRALSRLLIP